ncbi:hypothetical protein STM14_2822 [Salmonella enterica subsp. enterica serovar Typhimurium str. 14028S]|uniref:Uncharacterized protein n=1 Tax=Salmonella typhimurium (strain 14028s / SGSC 2262) TaxID=588858 RepID=A0A0F6B421_SALT1|nr:hypothetical protein STM14_2822 [Salmonella enterica subsp. enterica serovar Typhimurium str. 14028S]
MLATDYFGYKRGCLFAITCPIWLTMTANPRWHDR